MATSTPPQYSILHVSTGECLVFFQGNNNAPHFPDHHTVLFFLVCSDPPKGGYAGCRTTQTSTRPSADVDPIFLFLPRLKVKRCRSVGPGCPSAGGPRRRNRPWCIPELDYIFDPWCRRGWWGRRRATGCGGPQCTANRCAGRPALPHGCHRSHRGWPLATPPPATRRRTRALQRAAGR